MNIMFQGCDKYLRYINAFTSQDVLRKTLSLSFKKRRKKERKKGRLKVAKSLA